MATSTPDYTDHQKSALVQLIITGGVSLQQACAQYGLSAEQLKEWVRLFRRAVRQALDHQLRDTLSVQGLDLDLSRAEFSGDLADIGVADLVQTIHLGRKHAHITIAHGGEASEVWCRAGRVVDARSGTLGGEAAFYRILAIDQGSIVADFTPNERPRRIQLSTPRLLLEGASSTGMRARLMHRVGDPGQVFCAAADLTASPAARLEPDELDVLSLFDGLRTVEEVLLLSGLRDARALEIVARLRELGMIAPEASDPALEGAFESPAPSSNVAMSYRPFVASALPTPIRLPPWLLACGAMLCSSLGALSVLVYTGTLSWSPALQPGAATAPAAPHAGALRLVPAPAPTSGGASSESLRCPAPMVWLAGGAFTMGTDSKRPALSLASPRHRVELRGFCLGAHEVTAGEYAACVDAGDCTPAHRTAHFVESGGNTSTPPVPPTDASCNSGQPGREQHPINCVSHAQAAAYCSARGGRLPTEAEWEFAARGAPSRAFPWGNERPTRSRVNACGKECERWHTELESKGDLRGLMDDDDGYSGTAPVGSFPRGSSPDGVEDLIGNVFEWTAEGLYTYEAAPSRDPRGPSDSDSFVIRGGNFNSALREFLDPALRFAMHRESYSHGVGFRCAADAVGGARDSNPSTLVREAPSPPPALP